MREIPLTRGYVALVDDEDFARLSQFKWQSVLVTRRDGSIRDVQARRAVRENKRYVRDSYMHREVMGVMEHSIDVDHKDGNGLNNQRSNLRAATRSQNCANGRHRINNSSGFKGVYLDSRVNKWQAQITQSGKRHSLGYYDTKEQAAEAYLSAAKERFGEFAKAG